MTDYLKPKFTVAVGSDAYRDNWERTFRGEGSEPKGEVPEPAPVLVDPLEHAAEEATGSDPK